MTLIDIHIYLKSTLILRIYLRDKDAAYREQRLATLVKDSIPVPEVYQINDVDDYRLAIVELKSTIIPFLMELKGILYMRILIRRIS